MKKLLALILLPLLALGQSIPNGPVNQGQVWTPTQWNFAWQSKQDIPTGPATIPLTGAESLTIVQNGQPVSTPVVTIPGLAMTSPDGSITITNPTGSLINFSVTSFGGAFNVLQGIYT